MVLRKDFMTKKLIRRLIDFSDDIESDRPYGRVKMVAFLVHKNKIISFGVNTEKTSLYQHRARKRSNVSDTDFIYDKTHAEIAALKKIHPSFNDWQNTEIIVISKKKDGSFRLARPCPICSKAISDLGIKKIYYTNSFGGITKETFIKGDFR